MPCPISRVSDYPVGLILLGTRGLVSVSERRQVLYVLVLMVGGGRRGGGGVFWFEVGERRWEEVKE